MCLCPLLNCYFSSELFFYEDPFFPQGWSPIPPTELNLPYQTSHSTHPSVLQAKDSILTPRGTDTAVGLARCRVMHTVKQNKEVYTKYQTGKKKKKKIPKTFAQHRLQGLCIPVRKWSGLKAYSPVTTVVVVQPVSCVQLFATPWTAAFQVSPSFFAPTHVHWVGEAIQPSHPLPHPASPPALNTWPCRVWKDCVSAPAFCNTDSMA